MGSKKGAKPVTGHPAASRRTGSHLPVRPFVLTIVIVAAVGALWWWLDGRETPQLPGRGSQSGPSVALSSPELAQRLIGRWQRTDAGYVIEIHGIDDNGHVEAAYFNPNSIHVSQAQASDAGEGLELFIELMDVGYPGATYTLLYIPEYDALAGVYHQPTAGQDFEVAFNRK